MRFNMNILVVEDEERIASFIKHILEAEKHNVTICESAEEVLENSYQDTNDILILDLLLPGRSGEYLLKTIRKSRNDIPVLVLSALGQISKKVELLNLGADDYLTKPFDAEELIARISALQRRYMQNQQNQSQRCRDLVYYPRENKCLCKNVEIYLTNKEGDVLNMLLQHKGKIVRTEDILTTVWHAKHGYHSNIVQATIRRLRKKINSDVANECIRNVHGIGYMIKE